MGGMLRRCCCVPPQGTETCFDRFSVTNGPQLAMFYSDYFSGGIDNIVFDLYDPLNPGFGPGGYPMRWIHDPPRIEYPLIVPDILRRYATVGEWTFPFDVPVAPESPSDWIGRRGFAFPEDDMALTRWGNQFNWTVPPIIGHGYDAGLSRFASTNYFDFGGIPTPPIPVRGRYESEARVRMTSATRDIITETVFGQTWNPTTTIRADGPTDTYGIVHAVSLGFPARWVEVLNGLTYYSELPNAEWMSFAVFLFGNNWGNHAYTPLNSSLAGKAVCVFQSIRNNVASINQFVPWDYNYSSVNIFHVSDRDVGIGSHKITINLETNTNDSIFFSAKHNDVTFASSIINAGNMLSPQFWQSQPLTGCLAYQSTRIVQPGWWVRDDLAPSGSFPFMPGALTAGNFETSDPAFVIDYSRLQFQDVS